MNATDTLERQLRSMLADTAPVREPEALFISVMSASQRVRQRPGLWVGLRGNGVGESHRSKTRPIHYLLVALLILALVGAAVYVGYRVTVQPPSVGPPIALAYPDGLGIAEEDGRSLRWIRTDGGYTDLHWSPDGRYIAALTGVATTPAEQRILRVLMPDGVVVGETAGVIRYAWAGSSELLIVRPSADGADTYRLIRPDGEPARDLPDPGGDPPISVSPNGNVIAVMHGGTMSLHHDIGDQWTTLVPSAGETVGSTAWSPNGSDIAFVAGASSDIGDLRIVSTLDSTMRTLVDSVTRLQPPRWDPTGSRLLIEREVQGQPDLYVVDANGNGQIRLTSDPGDESDYAWDPTGGRIMFTKGPGQQAMPGVWAVDADGSNPHLIATGAIAAEWRPTAPPTVPESTSIPIQTRTPSPVAASPPAVLPGEPWLLYSWYLGGKGTQDVFLVRPDGSGDHPILTDVPGEHKAAAWSRDGSRIAFVVRDAATPNGAIWTASADGTGASLLSDGGGSCPGGIFHPSWSPDDTRIVVVCYGNGAGEPGGGEASVAILDLATDRLTYVTGVRWPEFIDDPPRWSPDGSAITFSILHWDPTNAFVDGSLVAIVETDDGVVRRLTTFDTFMSYPDWRPDGAQIVMSSYDLGYIHATDHASNLYTIDPDGTGIQQSTHASVDGTMRIGEPRWAPDGSGIYVAAATSETPDTTVTDVHLAFVDATGGEPVLISPTIHGGWPDLRPTGGPGR